MIKVPDKPTIYVDVDDTLVMWEGIGQGDSNLMQNAVAVEYSVHSLHVVNGREIPVERILTQLVIPNKAHIDLLKESKAGGMSVVVWSQGGSDWAEAVVKALNLTQFVDAVVSKPVAYVDDLPATEFMTDRIYIVE